MGRAMMTAAMVGKTHGRLLAEKLKLEGGDLAEGYERLFAVGAIDRLKQGLQQLMAGARKFALRYIDRNDLVALTREAAEVSGIPYVMDSDREEVEKILG